MICGGLKYLVAVGLRGVTSNPAYSTRQLRANQTADNYLDPNELLPLVRHWLKGAFKVVRDAQTVMHIRFRGGVI